MLLCLWLDPYINFAKLNLLMQGGFTFIWLWHYASKRRECFVDLSLTPTQFLASNFLITAEHEFSPKKTQLETGMCNYSRMKVWGSSIT